MRTTSQHNERHDEQHNAPHNSEQSIRLPRRVIAVLIAALAAIILTGCSTGIGVAGDRNLQGIRTQDGDSYTGGYKADYSKFTGEEAVFGGTGKKARIHLNGHHHRHIRHRQNPRDQRQRHETPRARHERQNRPDLQRHRH